MIGTLGTACFSQILGDMPYMPYDAVDGRTMTASYGVDPYRMPYCLKKVLEPDGTVTVAVIRVPSGRRYGNGVQPYCQETSVGDIALSHVCLVVRHMCQVAMMGDGHRTVRTVDRYSLSSCSRAPQRLYQHSFHGL